MDQSASSANLSENSILRRGGSPRYRRHAGDLFACEAKRPMESDFHDLGTAFHGTLSQTDTERITKPLARKSPRPAFHPRQRGGDATGPSARVSAGIPGDIPSPQFAATVAGEWNSRKCVTKAWHRTDPELESLWTTYRWFNRTMYIFSSHGYGRRVIFCRAADRVTAREWTPT
jgi:hypothetical protein